MRELDKLLDEEWDDTRHRAARTILTLAGAKSILSAPIGPVDANQILDEVVRAARNAARPGPDQVTQDDRDRILRELQSRVEAGNASDA